MEGIRGCLDDFNANIRPSLPEDWPLPNCHLGVTVESSGQTGRIVDLVKTPASRRWISYEPALGSISGPYPGIHGIVVGCESGQNRRPCGLHWVREVRDDCQAAGVKLYVKQLPIDGKVVTDPALFPEDLRSRELPWQVGKRGE